MSEDSPHDGTLFCPYPWTSLCAETDGRLTPCSISSRHFEQAQAYPSPEEFKKELQNSSFIKQLRLDLLSGTKNPNCEKCWRAEESGMTSLRQHGGTFLKRDSHWAKSVTQLDGSYDGPIEFFDIRPGNKCNLKCRMCTVIQSSAWLGDHEFLTGEKYIEPRRNFQWGEEASNWQNIFANIKESLRHRDHVQIHFAGGEPLIEKHHADFLQQCIDERLAGKITLKYTSNITVLAEDILEAWKPFRDVLIAASIDGVGSVNDYIRFPSSWKTIERHLLKLLEVDHVSVWVQPCVSLYNIYYLPELYAWGAGREQVYRGQRTPLDIEAHVVHEPPHLSLSRLPESALAPLKQKISEFPVCNDRQFLAGALKFAQNPLTAASLEPFWNFTLKLDQRRRQSFAEAMPEWHGILKALT